MQIIGLSLRPYAPKQELIDTVMDQTYQLDGAFKPTTQRNADLAGPDYFPTPKWATRALIENEAFDGDIWECACGDGAMSGVLETLEVPVYSSDRYDRPYGVPGVDILTADRRASNIITKPPYNRAEGFVNAGLAKADRKLALLLRLAFLEGANRNRTIFRLVPPSRVWVFSERIAFYAAGAEIAGSGTTAYAWFVWDKAGEGGTELKWLEPGYKARFTHSIEKPVAAVSGRQG